MDPSASGHFRGSVRVMEKRSPHNSSWRRTMPPWRTSPLPTKSQCWPLPLLRGDSVSGTLTLALLSGSRGFLCTPLGTARSSLSMMIHSCSCIWEAQYSSTTLTPANFPDASREFAPNDSPSPVTTESSLPIEGAPCASTRRFRPPCENARLVASLHSLKRGHPPVRRTSAAAN